MVGLDWFLNLVAIGRFLYKFDSLLLYYDFKIVP